jgi:hypothetical protein
MKQKGQYTSRDKPAGIGAQVSDALPNVLRRSVSTLLPGRAMLTPQLSCRLQIQVREQ